jgi:hypothetical protein
LISTARTMRPNTKKRCHPVSSEGSASHVISCLEIVLAACSRDHSQPALAARSRMTRKVLPEEWSIQGSNGLGVEALCMLMYFAVHADQMYSQFPGCNPMTDRWSLMHPHFQPQNAVDTTVNLSKPNYPNCQKPPKKPRFRANNAVDTNKFLTNLLKKCQVLYFKVSSFVKFCLP